MQQAAELSVGAPTGSAEEDLQKLIAISQAKKLSNGQWLGHCPAHDDHNPSMTCTIEDGRLLAHCFAGCSFEAILQAAGLAGQPAPIVRVNGNGHVAAEQKPVKVYNDGQKRTAAIYQYHDADGRLAYRKKRIEQGTDKRFVIERPTAEGWERGREGESLLYRLPDLVNQDRARGPVFLVEGEKCADLVASWGLLATTLDTGANSKLSQEQAAALAGRDVYILPDNDEPGRQYAERIAGVLDGVAQTVKVVELDGLPVAGDVVDWFESHQDGARERLLDLVERSAVWAPETAVGESGGGLVQPQGIALPEIVSGQDLLARVPEQQEWLIQDILAKGNFGMLGGGAKMGKSWLLLTIMKGLDLGLSVLERETRQSKVLYVALEDGWQRVQRRVAGLRWSIRQSDFQFSLAKLDGATAGETGPGLQQLYAVAPQYDLIIVDTLIAALSGRQSENDNAAMSSIVYGLATLAHETKTAVMITHHFGKMKYDDPFDSFRGASAFRGSYDVGLALVRNRDEREAVLHVEGRDTEYQSFTIRQAENGLGWEMLGAGTEIKRIRAGRKALEWMAANGDGVTAQEIASGLNIAYQSAHSQLERLERDGLVYREVDQLDLLPESEHSGRPRSKWYLR